MSQPRNTLLRPESSEWEGEGGKKIPPAPVPSAVSSRLWLGVNPEDPVEFDGEGAGGPRKRSTKQEKLENIFGPSGPEPELGEDGDPFGIGLSKSGKYKTLPKMRSRFSLSHTQILNLNDPFNQAIFEANIGRINHLLQSMQSEYCENNFKKQYPEENTFKLNDDLLTKLVYQEELDLAGNFLKPVVGRRLNDSDAEDLAFFLANDNRTLKLNIPYNDFGDEAAFIFARVLLDRPDITHLNLARNNITAKGFQELFECLMERPPLHCLKLSGNKLEKEGFQSLMCLAMCGKCPLDLDVSETDMEMSTFQGLCTALQALDRDEDFPKLLLEQSLPIPLEVLAQMKAANNDIKQDEYNLIRKRSVIELIRKDAGDMGGRRSLEKMPEFPKEADVTSTVSLIEKVSATILQGLFQIPETQWDKEDPLMESTLERGLERSEKIALKAGRIPDTELIIEEFKQIREAGCIPLEPDGRPVIVCPELYSLDVDDVLLETGTPVKGHFVSDPMDDMIMAAQEIGHSDLKTKAPDDDDAEGIATIAVENILEEAGDLVGFSEFGEKADTAQILLSCVLETCQRAKALQNEMGEFPEEKLQEIWEAATEDAIRLIYQKIPAEHCSLTPLEIEAFVRTFMETTNRTLLRLLDNPFIPPLIFEEGTTMCRKVYYEKDLQCQELEDGEDSETACALEVANNYTSGGLMDYHQAQRIVMSFLEGAITSAANIIGSGDPFYFRQHSNEDLADALEQSKMEAEETEERVVRVVKDFVVGGAALAVEATRTHQELEEQFDVGVDPAVEFLEEAFGQVANLILDMEKRRDKLVMEKVPEMRYPFVSRPHRLVMNRPLFQDYEPLMAAKMGDFLRDNTTVKCLHMRKWDLGEDGMDNLMDGLALNSNIVLLDLAGNAIGPEGVKRLVPFIKQNHNLKHLILNQNRLRNPGLKYLCAALPGTNIQFLDISYNDIAENLEILCDILTSTNIRALHVLGNRFTQSTWNKLKQLFDSKWLSAKNCDFLLQEVDGSGLIVKNAQMRTYNEWYEVPPIDLDGLKRAPYFEENAHILAVRNGLV